MQFAQHGSLRQGLTWIGLSPSSRSIALRDARTLEYAMEQLPLHLALLALDVRPGDEILIPSLTYIATANACRYVGAEPVFVDVDPETWCIDPAKLEASITRRTRGICRRTPHGHPADMDAINHVAGRSRFVGCRRCRRGALCNLQGTCCGFPCEMCHVFILRKQDHH